MNQFEGVSVEVYENTSKELDVLKLREKEEHEKLDLAQKI